MLCCLSTSKAYCHGVGIHVIQLDTYTCLFGLMYAPALCVFATHPGHYLDLHLASNNDNAALQKVHRAPLIPNLLMRT